MAKHPTIKPSDRDDYVVRRRHPKPLPRRDKPPRSGTDTTAQLDETAGTGPQAGRLRGAVLEEKRHAPFSTPTTTLDGLFIRILQDIYYTENRMAKSLRDMIEKAASPELKRCV